MKTLRTFMILVTLAVICAARSSSSSLPHPWLSLDRSAKVLRLVCRPPPQALEPTSTWQYVDDLKLFAFLPQHNFISNVSLVSMTSSWTEPKANPKFSISRVSFQGTWSSKSVSLEYLLPVSDKELGHYFCVVDYRDNNDKIQTFATRAVVDRNFVFSHVKTKPRVEQNFEVSVSDAHKVHVTWTKPEQSTFQEASVSVELVGDGRKSKSLFATDGDADFAYGSEVLLKKVNYQDGNNMSITLFVERDQQKADYRYACWVPYPACRGEDEVFCSCCQQGNNPDRQVCPEAAEDPETYFVGHITFAVLSALLSLSLMCCVMIYVLFKTGRCSESVYLQKIFSPRREIVSTLEEEKQSPFIKSPPKVSSGEQGNAIKQGNGIKQSRPLLQSTDPLSRQNDKGRNKTTGDNMRKDRRADTGNRTQTVTDDDIDDKQPLTVVLPTSTDTSDTSCPMEREMDRDIH